MNEPGVQHVVTHEVGHGLGLDHIEETGNLMNPSVNVAGTASVGQLTDDQIGEILDHPANRVVEK